MIAPFTGFMTGFSLSDAALDQAVKDWRIFISLSW